MLTPQDVRAVQFEKESSAATVPRTWTVSG